MRVDAFVSITVIFCLLLSSSMAGVSPQGQDTVGGAAEYVTPDSYVNRARESGMYLELSLQNAVRMALENNLQIEIEGYRQELNEESIYGTKGYYDPIFNSTVGWNSSEIPTTSVLDAGQSIQTNIFKSWTYNTSISQAIKGGGNVGLHFNTNSSATNSSYIFINPSYGSYLTLSLNQPLWRGFRHTTPDQELKIYNLDTKINESQFKRIVSDVIYQVQSQYWDLTYTIQNHEARRQSLQLAIIQLNNDRERVDIGSLAPIELTSSKAEAASRSQELISQEVEITNAQNNLKAYLTPDTKDLLWGKVLIPTEKPIIRDVNMTLDEAVDIAFKKSPELEQINYQMDQNEVDREYYKNKGKPDVSFNASLMSRGTSGKVWDTSSGIGGLPGVEPVPLTDHPFYGKYGESWSQLSGFDYLTYNIGLSVEIPIFNRRNKADLAKTAINNRRYQTQILSKRQSIMVEVRNAFQNIITQGESMEAARVARELSEEQLAGETKRLESGRSTNFEVLLYQRDLADAHVNELRARINYQLALASLQAATFTIVDDNDIVIAQQNIGR